VKIPPTQKGVACEHTALAWLIKKGYFCFHATGSHSPIDIVALKYDKNNKLIETRLVDVKKTQVYTEKQGRPGYEKLSKGLKPQQKQMGVEILLVYRNGKCVWHIPKYRHKKT
tara:strand:- start:11 stop:349 length:339 start_codon:yes stop_codon:yes gene_type:complete